MSVPRVWVDGDSCPRELRDFLLRSADKRGFDLIFVGNRPLGIKEEGRVGVVRVAKGEGMADTYILEHIDPGTDLVVTRDIPLAAELVERGVAVLNDRGTVYEQENVHARLRERDLKAELRGQGLIQEGRRTYGPKEIRAFAAAFDRMIVKKL